MRAPLKAVGLAMAMAGASVAAVAVAAWFSCGGTAGLLQRDPRAAVVDLRASLERGLAAQPRPCLVYFGDSSCYYGRYMDAADWKRPKLKDLLQMRLTQAGILGPRRGMVAACMGGCGGKEFEEAAGGLRSGGSAPDLALVVGDLYVMNGLYHRDAHAAGSSSPTHLDSAVRRAWRGATVGMAPLRFGLIPRLARAVLAWARATCMEALTPQARGAWKARPAAGTPQDQAHAKAALLDLGIQRRFEDNFADGYDLDRASLDGLMGLGRSLGAHGCRVYYYLTPVNRGALEQWGGQVLAGSVERGAQVAVVALKAEGWPVLDLHGELQGHLPEPPASHLDLEGRQALAERLAVWLKEQGAGQ